MGLWGLWGFGALGALGLWGFGGFGAQGLRGDAACPCGARCASPPCQHYVVPLFLPPSLRIIFPPSLFQLLPVLRAYDHPFNAGDAPKCSGQEFRGGDFALAARGAGAGGRGPVVGGQWSVASGRYPAARGFAGLGLGGSGAQRLGPCGFGACGLRGLGSLRAQALRGSRALGLSGDAACPCGARCASPPPSALKMLNFFIVPLFLPLSLRIILPAIFCSDRFPRRRHTLTPSTLEMCRNVPGRSFEGGLRARCSGTGVGGQ